MFDPGQVYQPSDDTFLLAEAAKRECRSDDRVIEIGTGSGYVSSEIQASVAFLVATDINPHAANSAHENGVEVVRTDLFQGICGKFDLVLFNPPYLPTQPEERIDDWLEYALDGGPDGRRVIERFAREVCSILVPEGRILLLVSSLTGFEEVSMIFEGIGMKSENILSRKMGDGEELAIFRLA